MTTAPAIAAFDAPSRIVAIGASAGGLESLGALFEALPPATGMAFLIAQHLSPDFHSVMDELIARHTAMRVAMARHDDAVSANRIYILPPGKEMIVRGGRIALADRDGRAPALPIDTLFRALALDAGPRAVAIVLSGAGRDGARGVAEIKRAGGVVLAESPRTARFDTMPQAAAEAGTDRVAAPRDLARALLDLPAPGDRAADAAAVAAIADEVVVTAPAVRAILALLRERFGLDFTQYRTATVTRRIQRRLDLGRIPSLPEYLAALPARPEELDALYRDLLIGVTQFFRDPDAFDALEHDVIPRLVDGLGRDEPARVWIAGCATGEEAYSIAMLLIEAFEARDLAPRLAVRATDVHPRSLALAAQGSYAAERLTELSEDRIARFFVPRGRGFQVTDELRAAVTFEHHDVTSDPPPTGLHLISCRNMLIYLAAEPQRAVLAMFHFALAPGGFLFLGSSESPAAIGDDLVTIDDRWKLYQRATPGLVPGATAALTERRPRGASRPPRRGPRTPSAPSPSPDLATLDAYDQLLDLFMPPGFLIDQDGALLDSFAGAERLLHAPARRPSAQLLELLDDDLRVIVGRAIRQLQRDAVPVSYADVPVELDGPCRATLIARSLASAVGAPGRIVVTLHDLVREPRDPPG